MRQLFSVIVLMVVLLTGGAAALAQEEEEAQPAAEPEAEPAAEGDPADADGIDDEPEGPPQDLDGDGDVDGPVYGDDYGDALGDDPPVNSADYLAEWGEPYIEDDIDGDGTVSAEEQADAAELDVAFAGLPETLDDELLASRDPSGLFLPSLDVETFRKLVRLVKKKVITRLKAKIAKKAEKRMATFSWIVVFVSLAGFLLLLVPIFRGKKYPFKYAAVAAGTWFVTVNLFGGVLLLMRGAQTALGDYTNPQIAIASGFFDSLDDHADEFIVIGKEMFVPTLHQLQGATDEQPAVALLANGQKMVKDAKVFLQVAKMFKRVSFLFGVIPIVLLVITLVLFVLAIKPTLVEIIKMPADGVFGRSMTRVFNEGKATLCTIGVLVLLTILAGTVLGRVVQPALLVLLNYFTYALMYLQYVKDGSTAMVLLMLVSVILFLVLNLAVVIASMSMFLGKAQKIFQRRFHDGVPLGKHSAFWQWGVIAVVGGQLFPLLYSYVARFGLDRINEKVLSGATTAESLNWKAMMLAGPIFLVFGFVVLLWASQALRGLVFLARYKPKSVV